MAGHLFNINGMLSFQVSHFAVESDYKSFEGLILLSKISKNVVFLCLSDSGRGRDLYLLLKLDYLGFIRLPLSKQLVLEPFMLLLIVRYLLLQLSQPAVSLNWLLNLLLWLILCRIFCLFILHLRDRSAEY